MEHSCGSYSGFRRLDRDLLHMFTSYKVKRPSKVEYIYNSRHATRNHASGMVRESCAAQVEILSNKSVLNLRERRISLSKVVRA